MLFALRRPHYEREFYRRPAIRMFQPSYGLDLDDFLFPAAAMMAYCAANKMDKCLKDKNPRKEDKIKDVFEVEVEAQHFLPEELDVKIVDNFIIVTGRHEEKQDEHGYISREFVRKYSLPEGVKGSAITCNMSSDGVLTLSAPLHIQNAPESEVKIPISLTGQPFHFSASAAEVPAKEKVVAEASPIDDLKKDSPNV